MNTFINALCRFVYFIVHRGLSNTVKKEGHRRKNRNFFNKQTKQNNVTATLVLCFSHFCV